MKKYLAILAVSILLLSVVLASGCIETEDQNGGTEIPQLTPEQQQDRQWLEKARDEKNPELCENISQKSPREGCFATVAEKLKDASICSRIESENLKNYCNLNAGGETNQ